METIELPARYGYNHKLEHVKDDLYVLKLDPKSCGTYRVIGFENESKIGNLVSAIDPEGGPYIYVGMNIGGRIVKSITINGLIELKHEN